MKGCPEAGSLRAYLDNELGVIEARQVREHLADCAGCAEAVRHLEADAGLASMKLVKLRPGSEKAGLSPAQALARFQRGAAKSRSVATPSWGGIGAQVMRLFSAGWKVGAGVAIALCLVALVAIAPVRSAAEDLLSQFRVQRFAAVTVDPTQIPEPPRPDQLGKLEVAGSPQIHQGVTFDQAQSRVKFDLKTPSYLPADVPTVPQYAASDEAQFTYTIDRDKLAAYLAQIGAGDVLLADELDGAVVSGRIPSMVAALYASEAMASEETQPSGPAVIVMQGESPSYEVPPDLMALRDELLQSPAVPTGIVSQLAAIQDWQSTVVVPVPTEAESREVTVQGQSGLLISEGGKSVVMWEQDGIVYAVAGNISEAELIRVAESLH